MKSVVLTTKEIAEVLGVTARAVTKRAARENWPKEERKRVRGGGAKYVFPLTSLPAGIRIAWARKNGTSSVFVPKSETFKAGAEAGRRLALAEAEAREQTRITREKGLAEFNRLPEDRRRVANAKYEILAARDAFIAAAGLPIKRGSIIFCEEVKAGRIELPQWVMEAIARKRAPLSWSSLNRWKQAYEEHGLVGLTNNYKSPNRGRTSVPEYMQDFIKGMLVDHPHASLSKIMAAIEARFSGQAIPHKASIRRWLISWKNKHASLLEYIANPDAWKSRRQFAMGNASERVGRLNQVWEFDSTPADVMLADGRYTLIGVIDVYSRRAKLQVAPTSKAAAIAALTRRAILDWGVPETAKTDNGSDYISRHMVRVFDSLEIEQVLCPPFTPEAKPHIERFFRTFSHDIVELLPGYIGHNVADRKAIEARRSFADRLMKNGGDPVELNQLTAAQLQEICDRWVTAIYHHNEHKGLSGRTPAEVARAWPHPVRRITDERALDVLLSPAPKDGGHRTITKKGVQVDNVYYIAPEMARHEGERVLVLLDATDLGTIYLYTINDYGEQEYLCTAVDPARVGRDRGEIEARTRALQGRYMREGRKELKKIAREQATSDIHREILEHREAQIANITELPRQAEEYTTHALREAAKAVRDRDRLNREQAELESLIDDLAAEREAEAAEYQEKISSGVVPIFTSQTHRYQWIRDRLREGARLTGKDSDFLGEFYGSAAGRMFLDLEGDLREIYGHTAAKR